MRDMGEVGHYIKVKKDGRYSWPWNGDVNRTIELFTDDVLTKAKDGTYNLHTGIGCCNIQLKDDEVEAAYSENHMFMAIK